MKIEGRAALITGAAGGIGKALALEMARRGAGALALVDRSEGVTELAGAINDLAGRPLAHAFSGDATDPIFRSGVFATMRERVGEPIRICVPAAGITRDELAVKFDKEKGAVRIYPIENFRLVIEVNLIAPVYWALDTVAGVAAERRERGMGRWRPDEEPQGAIIFIGSVSSLGNKGQIAYAAAKAGLDGAAATLMMEAIFHGVRCGVLHPGYTDTPMVRALGDDFIRDKIIPCTVLRRLIKPAEIADAICFMIGNSAVSGTLWADAGWKPAA